MNWSAPFNELAEGERFHTRGRTVTESDVVMFAALTGDWHPQHADAEWAADGPFGQRIAHGMLVMSFAVGLVPFDPERVMALRRVRDVVFRRPVRLGDTVHVEGSVRALKPASDEAGLVTLGIDVVRQDARRACAAQVEVLWRAAASGTQDAGGEGAAPCGEDVWAVA
ncbi:MAG TPA: MaoC/PaaZ C-terminal domain-containing protein [Solirubrobacteraceae bacterium]